MILGLFGSAQSVMLNFPFEKPMFLREFSTGTCKAPLIVLLFVPLPFIFWLLFSTIRRYCYINYLFLLMAIIHYSLSLWLLSTNYFIIIFVCHLLLVVFIFLRSWSAIDYFTPTISCQCVIFCIFFKDGGPAYFLCKTVVEVPLVFLQLIVQYLLSYFMMSLQGNFILLVLATFGLSMTSNSLAMLLGCLVADGEHLNYFHEVFT